MGARRFGFWPIGGVATSAPSACSKLRGASEIGSALGASEGRPLRAGLRGMTLSPTPAIRRNCRLPATALVEGAVAGSPGPVGTGPLLSDRNSDRNF